MKIFFTDKDRDLSNTKKYSFLNWYFDDGYGKNQCSYQYIFDNYNMGKAFIGNAIISLYKITELNNYMNIADKLIFPIFFELWHGLELWLKSSISAITLLTQNSYFRPKGHDIYNLKNDLEILLKELNCKNIMSSAMLPVYTIIDEFIRVNANFDFARYSFKNNNDYQFYNAPLGSSEQWQNIETKDNEFFVPNTCVDLNNLLELLIEIFELFGAFVEYLTLCISVKEKFSDENYNRYLAEVKNMSKDFSEFDSNGISFIQSVIQEIML